MVFSKRRPPTNCRDQRYRFPTIGWPLKFCITGDTISISAEKTKARELARVTRANTHASQVETAKATLAKNKLGFLPDHAGVVVSGFMPLGTEINITGLMAELALNGNVTCLPIVIGEALPLVFRKWQPGDDTQPGVWDIPIPLDTAEIVEPDILLVPLLAFDQAGYRVGYGGGFYDRTIEALQKHKTITTIGVAYSVQQIANVPRDHYDQKLDWILTEKGAIKCG